MANGIVNIRFGSWHFQIDRDAPFVSFRHNPYHDEARKEPGWKWFEVY